MAENFFNFEIENGRNWRIFQVEIAIWYSIRDFDTKNGAKVANFGLKIDVEKLQFKVQLFSKMAAERRQKQRRNSSENDANFDVIYFKMNESYREKCEKIVKIA